MRLYKVIAKPEDQVLGIRFAGSMAEVKTAKAALMEQFDLTKKQVDHEEVELPTGKQGTLEFLNELCAGFDLEASDE